MGQLTQLDARRTRIAGPSQASRCHGTDEVHGKGSGADLLVRVIVDGRNTHDGPSVKWRPAGAAAVGEDIGAQCTSGS